jgi:hypothetical protein
MTLDTWKWNLEALNIIAMCRARFLLYTKIDDLGLILWMKSLEH